MLLDGERLHRLILQTYDPDDLASVLFLRLKVRLDSVAPAGQKFETVVFKVLLWADQQGITPELIQALAANRAKSVDWAALLEEYGAGADSIDKSALPAGPFPAWITAFVHGYERMQRVLPPSNQRTVLLEEMVTDFRKNDVGSYDVAGAYHLSHRVGERLAAVIALRMAPDARYLRWLAERMAVESAFIAYQAAVALKVAAETLAFQSLDQVVEAVITAKGWLVGAKDPAGRLRKLDDAITALASRRA